MTPCIGPVLGGILALATVSSTSGRGITLMLAYCLGLGLAAGSGRARRGAGQRTAGLVHPASCGSLLGQRWLLMLIGFLMITNLFARWRASFRESASEGEP